MEQVGFGIANLVPARSSEIRFKWAVWLVVQGDTNTACVMASCTQDVIEMLAAFFKDSIGQKLLEVVQVSVAIYILQSFLRNALAHECSVCSIVAAVAIGIRLL